MTPEQPELNDATQGSNEVDSDPFDPTSFFMVHCFPQLGNEDTRTRRLDRPPPPGSPP